MFNNITQIIPTIQGEGPKVGIPSLLIRWKACNLQCPFCDTQWSNKHTGQAFSYQTISEHLEKYPKIDNIMFTGGEPFIYSNDIGKLANQIGKDYSQIKTIEIESNGTLVTETKMKEMLSQITSGRFKMTINISPKLGPECYDKEMTSRSILLKYKYNLIPLARLAGGKSFDYIFKIVYSDEWKDAIIDFLNNINPISDRRKPSHKIYIMPKTPDFRDYPNPEDEAQFIKDFRESNNKTVQFCLDYGLKFSCREHVWIWYDKKNELIEANV